MLTFCSYVAKFPYTCNAEIFIWISIWLFFNFHFEKVTVTCSDGMAALKAEIFYFSSLFYIFLACLIKLILEVLYIDCTDTRSISSGEVISSHAFFPFRQF